MFRDPINRRWHAVNLNSLLEEHRRKVGSVAVVDK
jgi:hypothetical protein